jgi:hypothetical protein
MINTETKKEIHNHQNKSFVKPQIKSDDMDIKYKYEKAD